MPPPKLFRQRPYSPSRVLSLRGDFADGEPPASSFGPLVLPGGPVPAVSSLNPLPQGGASASGFPQTADQLASLMIPQGSTPLSQQSVADQLSDLGQTPTYVSYPPWIYPPASSQPLDEKNKTRQVLGPIGADQIVLQYRVPPGKNGVIRFIANVLFGGGFQDGSGSVVWRLEADGAVVPGFSNVIWSMGSFVTPGPFYLRVFEQQLISMILFNNSLAPTGQLVGALNRGWYWPVSQELESTWL